MIVDTAQVILDLRFREGPLTSFRAAQRRIAETADGLGRPSFFRTSLVRLGTMHCPTGTSEVNVVRTVRQGPLRPIRRANELER